MNDRNNTNIMEKLGRDMDGIRIDSAAQTETGSDDEPNAIGTDETSSEYSLIAALTCSK